MINFPKRGPLGPAGSDKQWTFTYMYIGTIHLISPTGKYNQ